MKKFTLLLGVFLWMPAFLFADQQENHGTWSEDTRFRTYERFFIASQPDQAALGQAQKDGVSIVINLRGPSESDWDERSAAESLGLEYHQVPINGAASTLPVDPFDEISAIVAANPGSQILLHCASGNRAAAWLAVYLAEVEGLGVNEAIEIANANGLRKGLETKVRVLLEH